MGIDEAGRGALAGPVVIAGVVLNYETELQLLNDSKLLSASRRELLYPQIISGAYAYKIVEIDVKIIDQINIREASLRGFSMVYKALREKAEYALVDGRDIPSGLKGSAVVRGDGHHACIAAASILAKVYRDRLMLRLDSRYPEYGFARHKGYGTQAHYLALTSFGPCVQHRKSFRLS